MKITVVVDNTVPNGAKFPYLGEHGFSLLLEHEGRKILFDAGQSHAVVNNLSLLGVHPSSLDMVILSHGHYDHVGGLMHVLAHADKKMPVYLHPAAFKSRYSVAGEDASI